jgi:hypothetical protein
MHKNDAAPKKLVLLTYAEYARLSNTVYYFQFAPLNIVPVIGT